MSRAYRITTDRLVIRCWDPADAALLKEAVDSSLEHLLPWMPWAAAEPTSVEQKADLLRTFAEQFARGEGLRHIVIGAGRPSLRIIAAKGI